MDANEKNEGNQLVISSNHGTINITNNVKEDESTKHLHERIMNSFCDMERYFRENQFSIKKKNKK